MALVDSLWYTWCSTKETSRAIVGFIAKGEYSCGKVRNSEKERV